MKLGAFSISLNVKDLQRSIDFYEQIGFSIFAGHVDEKWIILKNDLHVIGLFENMLPQNMLTFNPGWNQNGENEDPYIDIREIHQKLKANNVKMISESMENSTGPASFTAEDPDGNLILFDQHRS